MSADKACSSPLPSFLNFPAIVGRRAGDSRNQFKKTATRQRLTPPPAASARANEEQPIRGGTCAYRAGHSRGRCRMQPPENKSENKPVRGSSRQSIPQSVFRSREAVRSPATTPDTDAAVPHVDPPDPPASAVARQWCRSGWADGGDPVGQ